MTDKKTGIKELMSFFVPLGLTASLMMVTHTIISAGLSRTLNPTVSTAAHAVALSLSDVAGTPLCAIRQTAMATINSQQSFQTVRRVFLIAMSCFTAVMLAIAYLPPITHLVLQEMLGVQDELLPATLLAFRVIMFLPILSGLRYLYHGVITIRRQTRYISLGMFFRVGFMICLIYSFTRWHWITGPLVGSVTLLSGIALECFLAYMFGRKLIPTGEATTTDSAIWLFYLPLIASSLLLSLGKPFINAGLARMPNAAVSLAAFSVASSLGWIIIAPSQTIHMLTMVFGRQTNDRPLVIKFTGAFALICTALLALISFGPVGGWILTKLIDVPTQALSATLLAMRTLALFPLIICWQEYNTGLLLVNRSTRLVGIGKAVNLCSTIVFVLLLAPKLPGPIAAPMAQMVGFACEGATVHGGRLLLSRSTVEKTLAA